MRKYLQVSFYTLTGVKKIIDLGESSYGEWIIYNNGIPKFHIHSLEKDTSNAIVDDLLISKRETIDSIIYKINSKQGTKLSFTKRPFFEIIKKEELIELDLSPLPVKWLKNLN